MFAEINNLDLEGVSVFSSIAVPIHSEIALSFKIPGNVPLSLNGQVTHLKQGNMDISFCDIDHAAHKTLAELLLSGKNKPICSMEFEKCYSVELKNPNHMAIKLHGFLGKTQCDRLQLLLNHVTKKLIGTAIILEIDASNYRCCAPSKIELFENWLIEMGENRTILGVLIGETSIGTMLVERLIRNADLKRAFTRFNNDKKVYTFLKRILSGT